MRSIKSNPASSDRRTSSDYTRSLRRLQVPPWSLARIFHGDPLVSVFLPLFKRQIDVPEKYNLTHKQERLRFALFRENVWCWEGRVRASQKHGEIPESTKFNGRYGTGYMELRTWK